MHWTVSAWRFQLHLLLCASVVVIEFVVALNTPNINGNDNNVDDNNFDVVRKDYNHFSSKFFATENETYTSDKRLIIEEFYRQSELAAKNSQQEMTTEIFHVNATSVIRAISNDTNQDNDKIEMSIENLNRRDKHSVTPEDPVINSLPVHSSLLGNSSGEKSSESHKDDKWRGEALLSRLLNNTIHPVPLINSNNYSRNSSSRPSHAQSTGKLKKTDAPMLNLVYDSHFKHRHPDFRLGTHFDEVAVGSLINVTIQEGKTAFLNCKINLLQDKTVSWVRRIFYLDENNETQEQESRQELQILTVGRNTFVADTRYVVDFQYPSNFRLMINNVTKRDGGIYECQISTHPPKVIQFYLHVDAPELYIADENQNPLYERHYEVNSTLELYCYVHNIEMTSSVVLWIHNDHVLNYDAIRGGVSVRTDLTEEGANSTLSVARINKSDSGNYTCSVGPTISFTTSVHVLNESFAELFYHGCSVSLIKYQVKSSQTLVIILAFLLILLSKLINCLPSTNECCLSVR